MVFSNKARVKLMTFVICLGFTAPIANAQSLSISEAVDMALRANTGLQVTAKGEDTAKASLNRAKGANGVSVTASASLDSAKTGGSERNDSSSLRLNGSLPLYTGGKNQAQTDSAKIGVETSAMLTERERENVKLSVIEAYYNALEAKKTIAVNKESVENYEAHLKNVEELYGAGAKAKIDVLRTSVELSNARQNLIKSENAHEIALARLRNIININRSEPLWLTDDFVYIAYNETLEESVNYAMSHRLDLRVEKQKIEQKELAIKAARAGYKPTVNFTLGTNASNVYNPRSDSSHGFSAGVGASWNIFDSGVTRSEVESAIIERDVELLNLKKAEETVDLSVREAYYNMKEAERRFTSTSDAVHEAEEDYRIAREKYRAGEGILIDILDAELARSTANKNYITAQYDYARYKAELENAVGLSDRVWDKEKEDIYQHPITPEGAVSASDRKDIEGNKGANIVSAVEEAKRAAGEGENS